MQINNFIQLKHEKLIRIKTNENVFRKSFLSLIMVHCIFLLHKIETF